MSIRRRISALRETDQQQETKVAYISIIIPDYKVWIVEALGKIFGDRFTAIHGKERAGTVPRDVGEAINIRRNIVVRNRYLLIGNLEFTWIPSFWWTIRHDPDVVVLIDQVKIISNYPIHLWMKIRGRRVVYYSHGFNHQATLKNLSWLPRLVERIRLFNLRRASAIVVYDSRGKQHLLQNGVTCPIYASNNTLDTRPILQFYRDYDGETCGKVIRQELGIPTEAFVITFLGRLIPEKRVDFMIEVVKELSRRFGNAVCGLIIGDGPERERLQLLANGEQIIFTGYQSGDDLRRLLSMSDAIFLPGLVGLAIVEAFCAGKPFITVDHDFHSPEICYLHNGQNGVLIPSFNVNLAVDRIVHLMEDRRFFEQVSKNAAHTATTECGPEVMEKAFIEAIGLAPS